AISASRMYMSGDEADPARLLSAQFDVGEVRGRNDVGAALRVAEAQVAGVLLESGGDLLPHLVGAGGGVEAQLTTGVDDADANFHAFSSVSANTGNSTGWHRREAGGQGRFRPGRTRRSHGRESKCRCAPLAWRA